MWTYVEDIPMGFLTSNMLETKALNLIVLNVNKLIKYINTKARN